MIFTVGQRVVSRRIGYPMMGTITSIHNPLYHQADLVNRPVPYWDDRYPDWRGKPVVTVLLDKPQKAVTREEAEAWGTDYSKVLTVAMMSYPIDDLEPTRDES